MLEQAWLKPADTQLLKRVRTLSVADAPDAFGATIEQVRAEADE